jgi:RNA polymerase sigma-70 factor, ECF subfamily
VDAAEFTRLFAAEAPRVWRLLRQLGVHAADLEDVCQEVFLIVHRRWHDFRGESSLRTWVIGIALRTALGHRRRSGLRSAVPLSEAHEPIEAAGPADAVEQRQLRAQLMAALDALPEGKREVFVLYELEELPMPEIAQLLEAPLHTCYSRLYAARTLLAAKLRRLGHSGAPR